MHALAGSPLRVIWKKRIKANLSITLAVRFSELHLLGHLVHMPRITYHFFKALE